MLCIDDHLTPVIFPKEGMFMRDITTRKHNENLTGYKVMSPIVILENYSDLVFLKNY